MREMEAGTKREKYDFGDWYDSLPDFWQIFLMVFGIALGGIIALIIVVFLIIGAFFINPWFGGILTFLFVVAGISAIIAGVQA